jgi:hypothetical protein
VSPYPARRAMIIMPARKSIRAALVRASEAGRSPAPHWTFVTMSACATPGRGCALNPQSRTAHRAIRRPAARARADRAVVQPGSIYAQVTDASLTAIRATAPTATTPAFHAYSLMRPRHAAEMEAAQIVVILRLEQRCARVPMADRAVGIGLSNRATKAGIDQSSPGRPTSPTVSSGCDSPQFRRAQGPWRCSFGTMIRPPPSLRYPQ